MPTFRGEIDNGRIILNVIVGLPGEFGSADSSRGFKALLDTGATQSGISAKVIDDLKLEHDGDWTEVTGVHGPEEVLVYDVSLGIPISEQPDEVHLKGSDSLQVAELSLDPEKVGFDVLLGMDFLRGFHLTIYQNLFILSS